MIPKDKIDEVRDRASIVEVVSDYVPLRRRGSNHTGLCPFHSEKTPSFSVNEDKRIFHCFGCGATGNVITFLMKKEGYDFPDAVRTLAKRFGVTITEDKGPASPRDDLYAINGAALDFFSKALKSDPGGAARAYLKKRGFDDPAVIERFSIGFAPDRWDALLGHLGRMKISAEKAEKAGLVMRRSGGKPGYYDRFRGRLIFPVRDGRGRPIGFGARVIGAGEPKYLNSPETAVFKKGEVLYGLSLARQAMIKEGHAIVVEGYFDVIAMHRAGFTTTVATMGTALTAEHLRALKANAGVVYALFDSDEAGRRAAFRGLPLFLDAGLPCRMIRLGHGKDPDEFLASSGPEAMREAMAAAEPLMEFCLKEIAGRSDIKRPEGKARCFDESLAFITRVSNVAERDHYAAFLAGLLGMPASSVYEALGGAARQAASDAGGAVGAGPGAEGGKNLVERTILRAIPRHPELLDDRVREAVAAFTDPFCRPAAEAVVRAIRAGAAGAVFDPARALDEIRDDGARGWAGGILLSDDDFVSDPGRMLEDCLKKISRGGKLKPSTLEMIRALEEAGRGDLAEKVRQRASGGRVARPGEGKG